MEPTLGQNIKRVIFLNRGKLLFSFFLMILSNALLVINPLILRKAIQDASLPTFSLPFWMGLLITAALLSALLKYWMRLGFFSVARVAEKEVRAKLFQRIQNQAMPFFDRHGTGELLSRLTNDISAYREAVGFGVYYPLFFVTLLLPAFSVMFYLSPPLTAVALLPLFAFPFLNAFLRQIVHRLSLKVQEKLADLSNLTQEHFAGIRTIRAYVVENGVFQKFCTLCKELIRVNFKLILYLGSLFPLFTFLGRVATVLMVWLAGALLLWHWGTLSGADLVSFMWMQTYTLFPVLILGWMLPIYARASAAYQRLYEVYQEPIEVSEGTDHDLSIPPKVGIEFKNLSFTYPTGQKPALRGINLSLSPGTFTGLTGPLGSGKSTIFRLINREYEIDPEMLYIGGHDIRAYTLSHLRQGIVTVEQAPFLFSKTIGENVSFGHPEASLGDVERVAEYADLHGNVQDFPEKYATPVGERGVTLSGGQKQRVALARALMVDRPILLLDDIFSALDTHTEKKIFQTLRSQLKGKTVLLITQRVSILEQLDQVVFLKEGEIIEQGTPQDLLARGGYFAALSELQRWNHA